MRKQFIPKPADPLQDQINALLALKLASKPRTEEVLDELRGVARLVQIIEEARV